MTPNDDIDPREENEENEATEAGDPVWKLLLEARKPEVSPFFARNVLREIRKLEEEESGLLAGLKSLKSLKSLFTIPRLALAGAAAVLVLVAVVNLSGPGNTGSGSPDVADTTPAPAPALTPDPAPAPDPVIAGTFPGEEPAPAEVDASFDIEDYREEVEMIDYLDGLLAVQDVEILDDAALAELLF